MYSIAHRPLTAHKRKTRLVTGRDIHFFAPLASLSTVIAYLVFYPIISHEARSVPLVITEDAELLLVLQAVQTDFGVLYPRPACDPAVQASEPSRRGDVGDRLGVSILSVRRGRGLM